MVVIGGLIVVVAILTAVLAPWIAPQDPLKQDVALRLVPPGTHRANVTYVLGSDQLGRDILSRTIYGARISLLVAFSAVALSLIIGTVLGLLAGYHGGWFDTLIMRLVDVQMSFPFILLAISILAILGPGVRNIIMVFALSSWPIYARTVRASVLAIREREFVEAAHAVGASQFAILFKHILPNAVSPLIVVASSEAARMIIMETALGFLGLGVKPPTAAWGNMLADARDNIWNAWWSITFPGLAIMITVLGINLFGDGLRDYLDPRMKKEVL